MTDLADPSLPYTAFAPQAGGNGRGPDRGRQAAFGAAARHSRRVRWLKVAVPALAVAGAVAFVGLVWLDPFAPRQAKLDLGTLSVKGDTLTMDLPHLTGFNKKQESYNVTARTASQHLTAPGQIDLTQLEAVIGMADHSSATLRATGGHFDSTAEILTLNDRVSVTSTRGYSAELTQARVDFKGGTVRSDQPVHVNLVSGTVEANAMSIADGGSRIAFTGGVRTSFAVPDRTKPAANTMAASKAVSKTSSTAPAPLPTLAQP